MQITRTIPSTLLIRDLYARMLLTRLVDDAACRLYDQGLTDFAASCRGHEAAQVGSAVCIEIGKDFTLPYYRDLGVVLSIGMTPYEVFRTYIQAHRYTQREQAPHKIESPAIAPTLHWGYHKHNTVTGPAPVATHILHAAGIAFASKLRKASVVTIAYCGDGATSEPDFLEGLRFAAQHQLPVVFICEQDCTECSHDMSLTSSCLDTISLPDGLTHLRIDGTDIVTVHQTMQTAMQQAREEHKPILLEMSVSRPDLDNYLPQDPLLRCQQFLQQQHAWNQQWADQLHERLTAEVEQAMQDALKDP